MKKFIFLLIPMLFIYLSLWPQNRPKSRTLFNLANVKDSIEYVSIGRGKDNETVEAQISFSINCKDLKLAVGKTMILNNNGNPTGGIFPESFGELDNPVTLDTTAVDTNSDLLFRKHGPIGEIWNFNVKFTDWNSYYLVFVIADMGECDEGYIKLWE